MPFLFDEDQIREITRARDSGRYADGYALALQYSSVLDVNDPMDTLVVSRPHPDLTAEQLGSYIWLGGAVDINRGIGPFSDFIRSYTSSQSIIRFGQPLNQAELDGVSNLIAF